MDERQQEPPRYPLPELVQPAPMLEPERNLFGTAMVYVGAAAIVVLVLYGLSRPEVPQQLAGEPSAATQTAPAGNAATPPPSTTGQGSSGQRSGNEPTKGQAKPAAAKGQPARSDSSNDTGSKNQPRQQAQ